MPVKNGARFSSSAPLSDKRATRFLSPKLAAISWNKILTKMRELAEVASSVSVIALRQDHPIESVYIKCAKKHAKLRSLPCSSLWTLSY